MLHLDGAAATAVLRQHDLEHLRDDERFEPVYKPCPGTSLLLAAIEAEEPALRALQPAVCVEIGCGCGVVAARLATLLPSAHVLASDINVAALEASSASASRAGARVDVLLADLLACYRPQSVDVAAFHCPYVPTSQEEFDAAAARRDFSATWTGGPRGYALLLRLLPMMLRALAPRGVLYLLFYETSEVGEILRARGMRATPIAELKTAGELLYVMRCTRDEKGVDADRREEEAQAGLCSCAEQPAAAAEGEARRTGA